MHSKNVWLCCRFLPDVKQTNHVPLHPLGEGYKVRIPTLEISRVHIDLVGPPTALLDYRTLGSLFKHDLSVHICYCLDYSTILGRQEMENDFLVSSSRLRYASNLPRLIGMQIRKFVLL